MFAPSYSRGGRQASGEKPPPPPPPQQPHNDNMTNNESRRKRKSRKKKKEAKRCLTDEMLQVGATVEVDVNVEPDHCSSVLPSTCGYVLDLHSFLPEEEADGGVPLDRGAKFCVEIEADMVEERKGRLPSVSESEDSFIVFDRDLEEEQSEGDLSHVSDDGEEETNLELNFPCKKVSFKFKKSVLSLCFR